MIEINIWGYLDISGNGVLTSLSSLDNLTSIGGYLDIINNDALISLSGLDNLTYIWGHLDISGNGVLTSLSGLDNIADASITDLTITNNSSLSTCHVQSICHFLAAPNGFIQIYSNAFGCNSQEEVEEACSMYCLPQGITFTTQAQIDNFQTNHSGCIEIEGNVTIQGSDITNLNGLNVLTSIIGNLKIGYYEAGNPALTSLSGMDNLTSIGGELIIRYNNAMTSLSGLDNLTSIGGYLDISGNGVLTSLSGLDNLTSIGRYLDINNNDALISLSGLDNLTSIGEDLYIGYNSSLISLSGLDNLTSIGEELGIYDNDALTSLSGLDNLTSIVGHLVISHSNALISLSGLDNLTSIGGYLEIYDNDALTSLSGLNNLTSIGGYLSISVNNALISLSGLDNLTSIGGALKIDYNLALTSLSGLNNLTSIGGILDIMANSALTSLSGLDNIADASITDLTITYNSSLSYCEVESICDYLVPPNGTVEIHDNANGCNSQAQVIAACEAQGIGDEPAEDTRNWNVTIFPNPCSGIITVEFEMREVAYVTVAFFNLTGQQVAEPLNELKNPGQQQLQLNVAGLPPGVYYCRLQAGNRNTTKKIMITD